MHSLGLRQSKPVTEADDYAFYATTPSFVDRLPWVEYLPQHRCMLLEDGVSVAAFFEVIPLGTEGRESAWLNQARDTLENVLQDSFDELDNNPWVVQLYAQDETNWDSYMSTLRQYLQPRAQDTAFSEFYLRFFAHHLNAIAKPGGLLMTRLSPACHGVVRIDASAWLFTAVHPIPLHSNEVRQPNRHWTLCVNG